MDPQYLECTCKDPSHLIRLEIWDWDSPPQNPQLIIETQLNPYQSFWKRLWSGLKFIFGSQTTRCSWDSTILEIDEVIKLTDFIEQYWTKWDEINELEEEDECSNCSTCCCTDKSCN